MEENARIDVENAVTLALKRALVSHKAPREKRRWPASQFFLTFFTSISFSSCRLF